MKLWPHGMYLVHGKPQEAAPAGVSEAEEETVPEKRWNRIQ